MLDGFTIAIAAGVMVALGVLMSAILSWANRKFHVDVDPRVEQVDAALPGANCGGCGYVGCKPYAKAVALNGESVTKCTVGGPSVAAEVAEIMGVEVGETWPQRAVVHCGATAAQRKHTNTYVGELTCAAANMVAGFQGCVYGCLGLADCVESCDYDAIHVKEGVAVVDYDACTGCEACAKVCPRNIISMVPFKSERMLIVACSNQDMGKEVKEVCEVGCIGCKACTRVSAPIQMNAALPVINYTDYDPKDTEHLDAAIEKCPMESLFFAGQLGPKPETIEPEAERVHADFKTTVDETEWWG